MKEEKKYTAGEAALLAVIAPITVSGVFLAMFPLIMYASWCDMHIWNWFAAPYFHLSPMPFWISVGIGQWCRMQTFSGKVVKDEKIQVWVRVFNSLFIHSTALLVAYIVMKKFL